MVISKRFLSRLIIFGLILAVVLFPTPARADVAPPEQPPGFNPEPGAEFTNVAMHAETVLIEVLQNTPVNSLGQARVTADFTMHNTGDTPETMLVRFPLSINDGFFNYPEIASLQVKVNGKTVSTQRTEYLDDFDEAIPWAEFEVTFPAGQDVAIQVAYTAEGTGEYPYISFKYILETGAGWHGPIGTGEIIVRLPYEANSYNVILDFTTGWSQTTPGGTFTGNEYRYTFTDLEPTSENNFEVSLVMPSAWQKALTEQTNVTRSPQDGEAWGRLGKIYKEISRLRKGLREDAGGQELYRQSQQAYEQALTLLPNDALWHAGYADLLWTHYFYYVYFSDTSDLAELLQILSLLDRSLTLAPGNPVATDLLTSIAYTLPEAVQIDGDNLIILYLTATPIIAPTATATPVPTETLPPTATLTALPQATATPSSTATQPPPDTPAPDILASPTATSAPPANSPGIQICGTAILALLPAFRRKKKR